MGNEFQDSIVVAARTDQLQQVREFMMRKVRESALPDREKNKVVLAVDEAVANIIKHAYGGAGEGKVQVDVRADARRFEILIFDTGQCFDPSAIKNPDMQEHVRLGKKTGLGIFLMRQIMDEVSYNFAEGRQNQLHLVKFIPPPDEGEKTPAP